MPTYVYKCESCNQTIEKFHAISAKPPSECEKCSGTFKRVPSYEGGIVMKGSSVSGGCSASSNCKDATPACGGCGMNSPCGI